MSPERIRRTRRLLRRELLAGHYFISLPAVRENQPGPHAFPSRRQPGFTTLKESSPEEFASPRSGDRWTGVVTGLLL
jgi:hypothetical protein